MPSPLTHAAAGFVVYNIVRSPEETEAKLLWVSIMFSLLPDADSILGVLGRDFARFHNNISHSLGFAVAAGAVAGTTLGLGKGHFWRLFSTGFLAYSFHLGLDYWSTRRGILLLWPFSKQRVASPTKLFYGLQWGRGIWSKTHLWTVLTELLFGFVLLTSFRWLANRLKK